MQFSRAHAWMLAIVSIFTGIIAPVGSYLGDGTPLPLTDKQWIAYVLFLLLAITFYILSIRNWSRLPFFGYSILGLLVLVFFFLFTEDIRNIRSGLTLTDFSWGWIFLVSGWILLYASIRFDFTWTTFHSQTIDKILGIIGTILLLLFGIIIMSISLKWPEGYKSHMILSEVFSGSIESRSGITLSKPYEEITGLRFERQNDALFFTWKKDGKWEWRWESYLLGNKNIVLSSTGELFIDGIRDTRDIISSSSTKDSLILSGSGEIYFLTNTQEKTFTGIAFPVSNITKDASGKTLSWAEKTWTWFIVKKNGGKMSALFESVEKISLSPSGYDVMIAWQKNNKHIIIKNNDVPEEIKDWYVEKSYKSNGSHSIYKLHEWGIYRLVYDGIYLPGKYEEIREVFLERSGNSYEYFARPLWDNKYCLFTRYRGNICGIEGYMNPILSADGGSVLYAGLLDNIWGIYRNTSLIVKETGYTKRDIRNDYAFYDLTNPRVFLFIEKNDDGTYSLLKNGERLEWRWLDVWLDVTFGYDNKVIMTLKDSQGWRIAEF